MSAYLAWIAVFGAPAVGVLFGLDALGLITSQAEGGFVGLGLGSVVLVGAQVVAFRR
jgi:hypothetical protein